MYNDEMYPVYERRPMNKVGDLYLYQVEKGDNVWQIARQYNSSVDLIQGINHLNPNSTIYPGQQLLIPVVEKRIQPPYRNDQPTYDLYF